MYATIGAGVPEGGGWVFEPKWDGIRVLAHVTKRAVKLVTRNGKDKAKQFPEVVEGLRELARKADRVLVLDGEVVALGPRGAPARFQELQERMHVKDAAAIVRHVGATPAALIAFDLLRDGEESLLDLPWTERRRRLEARLRGRLPAGVRLGETDRGSGVRLLARARAQGWEGIIAKRAESPYIPGARSRDWLKLKVEYRQEFVVGGWTEPRNTREHLGALLLGVFEGGRRNGAGARLVYVGHMGGGFTRAELEAMRRRLAPLERRTPPFEDPPRTNEPAHWVRPAVVVEVKFSEWTADGRLRQPIFVGVRDDKPARLVTREARSVQ
ncbi:MAG: non-homologous end-joining DNA ligase [Gemmatimonadaceae bacterium]